MENNKIVLNIKCRIKEIVVIIITIYTMCEVSFVFVSYNLNMSICVKLRKYKNKVKN